MDKKKIAFFSQIKSTPECEMQLSHAITATNYFTGFFQNCSFLRDILSNMFLWPVQNVENVVILFFVPLKYDYYQLVALFFAFVDNLEKTKHILTSPVCEKIRCVCF